MISPLSVVLVSLLLRAAHLWGQLVPIPQVRISYLGECGGLAAWTTFDDRTITLNSECPIGGGFLESLLVHEYGHLLCLCADHNEDTRSIMNPIVVVGNQIMEEDRWRTGE